MLGQITPGQAFDVKILNPDPTETLDQIAGKLVQGNHDVGLRYGRDEPIRARWVTKCALCGETSTWPRRGFSPWTFA
jgi:hypothetical protein